MRPRGIQALRRDLARRAKIIEGSASHGHCRRVIDMEEGAIGRVADDASRRNLSLGAKVKGQMAIAHIQTYSSIKLRVYGCGAIEHANSGPALGGTKHGIVRGKDEAAVIAGDECGGILVEAEERLLHAHGQGLVREHRRHDKEEASFGGGEDHCDWFRGDLVVFCARVMGMCVLVGVSE